MKPVYLLIAAAILPLSCGTTAPNPMEYWPTKEVNLGYGMIGTQETLTASATRVELPEEPGHYKNIYEMIKGKCAGVQVMGERIIIRGVSTILASTDPLFIVNGTATDDISWINPNDVKTIDILKDGDACAIYGSRGANGVIIITLK